MGDGDHPDHRVEPRRGRQLGVERFPPVAGVVVDGSGRPVEGVALRVAEAEGTTGAVSAWLYQNESEKFARILWEDNKPLMPVGQYRVRLVRAAQPGEVGR